MQVTFRTSFTRDLKKIKGRPLLDRIRRTIEQVETATDLTEVDELKKMVGFDDFFRIRIGDYRLGIVLNGETIEFVRCLPRRDLYRFFP